MLLVLLLASCASTTPQPDRDAGGDPVRLAERGLHQQAAQAWASQAREQPENAASARRAAARQWLLAGRPGEAQRTLDELERSKPGSVEWFEVELLEAEIALALSDFDRARRILSVERDSLPETLRERYDDLRRQLERTNPDSPTARVEVIRQSLVDGEFEPGTALALLLELPLETLRGQLRQHADEDLLLPWLDLAITARANLLDDPALSRALGEWRQRFSVERAVVGDLHEWIRSWRELQPMPSRVTVLLPGQGPLVPAGEALRDGMLAFWFELPEQSRPELDFQFLPDQARAAVGARFEALEAGSDFIVGPLDRAQIEPLLNAPDAGIPMLLLNRPLGEIQVPPARSIAMLALPPEEEAELAAVRALVTGHERALVIAQNSDFGRRVAQRFSETFELGGGRVYGRVEHSSIQFDHTDQLRELLEVDRSEQRIEQLAGVLGGELESEPQRRTDVDLVFLATRGGDARQVMPQLRFLDLDQLDTYATSHVYSGEDAGNDLDGLQIPVSPWMLDSTDASERRRRAERQFESIGSSSTLSLIHALGRDAMALLRWLDMMHRDRLLYLPGNVGRLRLADGVVLERDLPWARIRSGRPVPVADQP